MKEMNECDISCTKLRDDITYIRNKYRMQLKTNSRCALTNQYVITSGEPFYVFPSGYVFLASALKKVVVPYLNEKQRQRVEEIERLLQEQQQSQTTRGTTTTTTSTTQKQQQQQQQQVLSSSSASSLSRASLLSELEGIIGAECPFTGSIMVESIDHDFDDSTELFQQQQQYQDDTIDTTTTTIPVDRVDV